MSRAKSGGGETMNKVSRVTAYKQEPINNNISPNRPSMIGLQHWQNDAKGALYQSSKATTPFGTTPSVAGPGGGRMVMRAGSQSATPAPRPMPASTRKF
jgi:hypothetical protein